VDAYQKLSALLQLAEDVGITVRRAPPVGDAADHRGGALVRLKGREVLFLNPSAAVADQIDVVAAALKARDEIEQRFLRPEIRLLIDEAG
jgi:hypothetical protein